MMISKGIFDYVQEGQELYKISKRTHTMHIGEVSSKVYTHLGRAFLMEMKDGTQEWATFLNHPQEENNEGWYLLV